MDAQTDENLSKGAASVLSLQLRQRFGTLSPEIEQRLEKASLAQLQTWSLSLYEADEIEDVFFQSFEDSLVAKQEDFQCRVTRISDQRYVDLRRRSLCIEPDYSLWLELTSLHQQDDSWVELARFYAMFSEAFGESGNVFDDWKGSFNFAFLLHVLKEKVSFPYLLKVFDHRGSVEFNYHKIIASNSTYYDKSRYYKPFASEFSETEMSWLSGFLWGFAEGYFKGILPCYKRTFLKKVPSNHIIFGSLNGDFFEHHYEEQATYNQEIDKLESLLQSLPDGYDALQLPRIISLN